MEMTVTNPGLQPPAQARAGSAPEQDWSVTRVLVVFKTHLDIGFTDLAETVRQRYIDRFIPNALETARNLRGRGGPERLVWTTGSWLIREFLDHARPDQRLAMERGIEAGDIAWHALPFTTHTELMDRWLMEVGLGISARLDAEFGRRTCAAKMTDVPGHTRAMVPLLARAGVRFLHIGVNPASTSPRVPTLFRWRDLASETDIVVMYNKGAYGDVVRVDGTAMALAVAHTNDNHGPQTPDEITEMFLNLRKRFPAAEVVASSLNEFADALGPVVDSLPVVTSEIGDTWIHGVGTDPQKVARLRELLRLRKKWSVTRNGATSPPALDTFGSNLLLVTEHTWGLDEKTHLADFETYRKAEFHSARRNAAFRKMESSWEEQRAYVDQAIASIPAADMRNEAVRALEAIEPAPVPVAGLEPVAPEKAGLCGPHASLSLRASDGAVQSLTDSDSTVLASPGRPWAVLSYRTFSPAHYRRFWEDYVINKKVTAPWSYPDFTKPGMEKCGARDATVHPQVVSVHRGRVGNCQRIVVESCFPADMADEFGAPRRVTIEYELPDDAPELRVTVQWFDKDCSRLPEALTLSFFPEFGEPANLWVDKMGSRVDVRDVMHDGNRSMHAVDTRVVVEGRTNSIEIETLDAPLVAFFEDGLLRFRNRIPTVRDGIHFVLYNNLWGTNFPMWNGESARFRFVARWAARGSRRPVDQA